MLVLAEKGISLAENAVKIWGYDTNTEAARNSSKRTWKIVVEKLKDESVWQLLQVDAS